MRVSNRVVPSDESLLSTRTARLGLAAIAKCSATNTFEQSDQLP